ncbi:unnamed protein product [Gongylonema pulchrum]|uniref:Cyclin-C n=1 Tax=Gongylonema pulchrum TaxID=637853 RepID=A0A183EWN1_9BILA|nr:unnamed protein product [Gongylonema pulchrum]
MDSQQPHKTRMQVIATACVYFRRFYARRSLKDIDPFLLAPTSLFLASKVEEHGMMSHNKLIQATNNALKRWPFIQQDLMIRVQHIQEAEFFLLEILDCCLIVYHPYRFVIFNKYNIPNLRFFRCLLCTFIERFLLATGTVSDFSILLCFEPPSST